MQAFFVHSKSSSIELKISRIHTLYRLNTGEVDKSTSFHHKESTGAHKKGLEWSYLLIDSKCQKYFTISPQGIISHMAL